MRHLFVVVLGLVALFLSTACINFAPGEAQTLTILYWQAPTVPLPYLSAGNKDVDASAITLEPLAKFDPDGKLTPALATAIPTPENGGVGADLMSITWQLKEGVKWSDGSDLTAADVVFTWRYCTDESADCIGIDSFDGVTSVEAVDDRTVRIGFDAPKPYPYTPFVGARLPIISQAQFADCVGAGAASCQAENNAPLGTGPYRIVSFLPNEQATYERNPNFRGAEPYFDTVILVGGGDAIGAARVVLEQGMADYAWNLQVEAQTLTELEAAGNGKLVTAFSSQVERLVVNQTNPDASLGAGRSEYRDGGNPHPFLTFTPIPQAMSMAIDRGRIVDSLYGFAGRPACNLVVGPQEYVSDANDGCLAPDVDGANRLLDEHGVLDNDGDGIREYQGAPLRVTFQTTANAIRESTQELIGEQWRQIGIATEFVNHDGGVFFGGNPAENPDESYRTFFADVQMYTDGTGVDPEQVLSGGLCANIQTAANNWSGSNNARMCDGEYDAVFAELSKTGVGPERAALVKRLNDIVVQNYYQIPLVNRGLTSAHISTLQGVRINSWDSELWNIAEWRR